MNRREFAAVALTGVATAVRADAANAPARLGLLIYSFGLRAKAEKDLGFAEPERFLAFAHARGANAVQLPLGTRPANECVSIRQVADRLGMAVEAIVSPPSESRADGDRFAAELATARDCGATVARTVLLGGRRYEVFTRADDFTAFARKAEASLHRAEPHARAAGVALAVENHKDYRADELADLLRKLSSEFVGVCLDTGNNLALLEDPAEAVAALAPFARTVHLKDIGTEEAADGFRMTEVPLGKGVLDLPAIVRTIRAASPMARFHLEMITRDPLLIPCLGEKYWATLGRVPGRDLARTLARVRTAAGREPLPRISALTPEQRLAAEDRHVAESFAFAGRTGLIPEDKSP